MPWQQFVIDVALEVDDAGRLVYDEVVLTVPRQSGKTTLILPLFVHRSIAEYPGGNLEVGPQRQTVAYTAQTRNDARKKWIKEFIPVLEKSGFRNQFDKRLTNGSEGFDWLNGSTFDLVATMEKSGHGDTLDLGIIDEAFAQTDDRLEQAMEPATITRQSPQIWIISTAGENEEKSPFLWGKVLAGREATVTPGSSTAYFEWSLGPDDDADDIDVVAARHPACGYTITKDDLRKKQEKARRKGVTEDGVDHYAGFKRAYCNVWGTTAVAKPAKLDAIKWAATKIPKAKALKLRDRPGPVLTFDVDLDSATATIGVSTGVVSDPYGQMLDHRPGVGWLADRLVELVLARGPIAIGYNAAGATLAQIGPIQVAFRKAGISTDLLVPVTSTEFAAACDGFHADVNEGRYHRPEGQQSVDLAGEDATERPLGDNGWAFARRQATVPVSPLIVLVVGRHLLPTELEPAKPVFAY